MSKLLSAAAVLALLSAAPAFAQTAPAAQGIPASQPNDANVLSTPSPADNNPRAAGVGEAGDAVNPLATSSTANPPAAPSATEAGSPVAAQVPADDSSQLVANAPVPDTPANRARFGGPMSRAGRATSASGD